ncbi:SDR family NAD(P)-dependent oxidoreductase [Streptomyces pinistramenti]|uniref:SDR family NAD(P)-dependent oxidoreductase n=1 Tax=Streptomyces pinistramenti TaxID=2884812 RepID=UPI001D06D542|nr:SDR family oxidoreductase [Streptomyces pinistramenti]MCB5908131.1 SDR family oxidoreductase [Streptomyces pinistramenti]
MNRFDHRRILVTGAASGIGQATALRLLCEGGHVVAADISEEGLATTRSLAEEAAAADRLHTLVLDIGDENSVISGLRQAIDTLGGLDVLVNAAGILRGAHTHETSLELWNRIITVNLTGTFLVTRQALPTLLAGGRGVVVNFSSTSTAFAHPYMAAYAASKGGIQSFTHTLALEYAKQGLRAVSVAPGSVKSGITDTTASYLPSDTDWSLFSKMSPLLATDQEAGSAPMAGPESVAGVIAMLASDDGAFITGTEIRIDGGTHA